jgi:hypothetical protein
LLDVGEKADRVDRLIEQAWRTDTVTPQRCDEGQRLAVTMGHLGNQPFADGAPPADRRYVRLRPSFVNENKPLGFNLALPLWPLQTPSRDLRAVLFAGVQAFF